MKLMGFTSIRNRLMFWLLLTALLPLSIALTITYRQAADVIETRAFDRLAGIRDMRVERFQAWMEERHGNMDLVASSLGFTIPEVDATGDKLNPDDLRDLSRIRSRLLKMMYQLIRQYLPSCNVVAIAKPARDRQHLIIAQQLCVLDQPINVHTLR